MDPGGFPVVFRHGRPVTESFLSTVRLFTVSHRPAELLGSRLAILR